MLNSRWKLKLYYKRRISKKTKIHLSLLHQKQRFITCITGSAPPLYPTQTCSGPDASFISALKTEACPTFQLAEFRVLVKCSVSAGRIAFKKSWLVTASVGFWTSLIFLLTESYPHCQILRAQDSPIETCIYSRRTQFSLRRKYEEELYNRTIWKEFILNCMRYVPFVLQMLVCVMSLSYCKCGVFGCVKWKQRKPPNTTYDKIF